MHSRSVHFLAWAAKDKNNRPVNRQYLIDLIYILLYKGKALSLPPSAKVILFLLVTADYSINLSFLSMKQGKQRSLFAPLTFFSYLCNRNKHREHRADRDTHQIKPKTEGRSSAYGGPHKLLRELSCKAGGLQRRGILKSCHQEFSSHRGASLFLI